jgi:hypothetical protein
MTIVFSEVAKMKSRLESLGLEEEPLLVAIAGGQLAVDNCTANHPPMFPGFAGWAETLRGVRDYLGLKGWHNLDENNYSRVVDPTGRIAIAVATGNEDTGLAAGSPTTKASKGLCTVEAIEINVAQQDMFPDLKAQAMAALKEQKREPHITWILLIHRAPNETRAELSLPVAIGDDMRVSGWQERIILRSISRDPDPIRRIEPPIQPDLDVQVTRRATK